MKTKLEKHYLTAPLAALLIVSVSHFGITQARARDTKKPKAAKVEKHKHSAGLRAKMAGSYLIVGFSQSILTIHADGTYIVAANTNQFALPGPTPTKTSAEQGSWEMRGGRKIGGVGLLFRYNNETGELHDAIRDEWELVFDRKFQSFTIENGSIRVSQRELRPFQGRDGSPATR
jgi:hypothetical protein